MPKLEPILRADIDPLNPVQELCAVIDGVLSYHPVPVRIEILRGLREAIDEATDKLKKEVQRNGKPVLQSDGREQDQG